MKLFLDRALQTVSLYCNIDIKEHLQFYNQLLMDCIELIYNIIAVYIHKTKQIKFLPI